LIFKKLKILKLSIVVPVYNAEKYLNRCIDSLLNQDLDDDDYEIIIIDDGSVDNSLAIAQKYLEVKSNITVFSQKNLGVSVARNRGIELAKGEFLYFIDSDDYIVSNILKSLIHYVEQSKLEILTFSSLSTTNSRLTRSTTENNKNKSLKVETGIEYIGNMPYKNEIWWFLIRRDFLLKTGIEFVEGRWMEDAIFTARLFLKSSRMAHVNIDVHRHVVTPNSAMTSKEDKQYLRVIRDNANAAIEFESLIKGIDETNLGYENCVKRLTARRQSFVFFMMVRMLQSSIKLKEIRSIISQLQNVTAYPLNSFLGIDYNKSIYKILVVIFNKKYAYYLLFLVVNPIFRLKNKING
jgi:glycosyltransferase involved in cell wall biosynthesis